MTAQSVTQLRALLGTRAADRPARSLHLVVTDWQAPWPGWSGRLGPVPGLVAHTMGVPSKGRGIAVVTLKVANPAASCILIDAALAVLDPARHMPTAMSPEVYVTDGGRPPWLTAPVQLPRPSVSGTGPVPTDIQLAQRSDSAAAGYSRYGFQLPGGRDRILVNASSANPIGRGPGQDLPSGALTLTTSDGGQVWWRIQSAGERPVLIAAGRAGDQLDVSHRDAIRRLGLVTLLRPSTDMSNPAYASVVAQLAMTGVVVHAPHLDAGTASLLAPELLRLIGAPLPGHGADPIEWELRSIAQRRAALRGHAAGLGVLVDALPSVSALLVTRRPNRVESAVADLVAQRYPNLEIIVGLHGVDLENAQRDRLKRSKTPIEVVSVPAELSLGAALATATSLARGSLVAKVDDDDIYGPEHIWDLVLARIYSGATVVGKAAEFVHLEAYDATVRRRMASETYSDIVAGAAMMIGRGDLEAVGGWRPLARAVDRAMLDRVLRAGGLIYRTHGFGFIATRHNEHHTWDPGPRYFTLNPLRTWPGKPTFDEFNTEAIR